MATLPNPTSGFNRAYTGKRPDIMSLVPDGVEKILDVGCATGSFGNFLTETRGAQVWGVEWDRDMAAVAGSRLSKVWNIDLNREDLANLHHPVRYDLVVFGDILEHLMDPWKVLKQAAALTREGGWIITSFPNVGHFSTLLTLTVGRRWPYRKRGIHDETHLRFFTRSNLVDLFRDSGLHIATEKRNLRLWESGSPVDFLAKALDFHPFRSFLTFQYLHLLQKS